MQYLERKCQCGKTWIVKVEKFISPGICICGSDSNMLSRRLTKADMREKKLKRILFLK